MTLSSFLSTERNELHLLMFLPFHKHFWIFISNEDKNTNNSFALNESDFMISEANKFEGIGSLIKSSSVFSAVPVECSNSLSSLKLFGTRFSSTESSENKVEPSFFHTPDNFSF